MKRLRVIIIVGSVVSLGTVAIHFATTPSEPTYKGRTLVSYLEGPWKRIEGPEALNPHFAPDTEAIRAIGTNGIPTLLRLIQAKDPVWKTKLFSLLRRQNFIHVAIHDAESRRQLGCYGFGILGDMAKPAASELIALANSSDTNVSHAARFCILQIQFVEPPPAPINF